MISHLTLSPSTGFYRLVQWDYGWREVMAHPLLGLGLNPWERPAWLGASIDRAYKRQRGSPAVQLSIRVWSITVVSIAVAALAVHFWAQSLVVFFFLLGCLGALSKTQGRARARP
jgi:hypothetical protein